MELLYFEDFSAGQIFRSRERRVTPEEIKAFAAQYDPQPFHLDEDAAARSFFRGLAASGWHTAALTMRLLVEGGLPIAGGIIGAGADELRWPRAVRPGDLLHVESEVLETRSSASRPESGWVKACSTTKNQDGETVQVLVANLIVPCRRG
jgi:acyl dehydratase